MKIIKVPTSNYSLSKYAKIGHQIHKTLGRDSVTELTKAGTNKSANALFARNGDVYELVDGKYRAWSSGRIRNPSARAKAIMLKTAWGSYVKPGYYLYQWEFECLEWETYTDAQYASFIEYCKLKNIPIVGSLFLTHQDTASYKPNLEYERSKILRMAIEPTNDPGCRIVLDSWSQFGLEVKDGKIILFKKN